MPPHLRRAATAPDSPARRPGALRRGLLAGLALALGTPAALTLTPAPTSARAGTHAYYVSPDGDDSDAGTSPDTAWATLDRAARQQLGPGDRLLLRRDATYAGHLVVRGAGTAARPVRVGAFGTGAPPVLTGGGCLTVAADHTRVHGLSAEGCDHAGIEVVADHVTLTAVRVSHNVLGIDIEPGASFARVLRSRVVDNDRMAPDTPGANDDYGAIGIDVHGDDAEIAWTYFEGQVADSPDYGQDGSAVEVYGARRTRVHHNRAVDNLAFTELGDSRSRRTTYAYNEVVSGLPDAGFLITRGPGDGWGPVWHTVAEHNSVRLTGTGTQAFWCGGTCGPAVLVLRDNVLVAQARVGYAVAPTTGRYAGDDIGGARNLYWGAVVEHRLRPGDLIAAPLFIHGLRLRLRSPAVDRARAEGWSRDLRGRAVPRDGDGDGVAVPDRGAFER